MRQALPPPWALVAASSHEQGLKSPPSAQRCVTVVPPSDEHERISSGSHVPESEEPAA